MLNLYLSLPTILLAKPHAELKEIQKKIKENDIELEECLRERALDNDLNSDQGDKDHPDEAKTAQDVEHWDEYISDIKEATKELLKSLF